MKRLARAALWVPVLIGRIATAAEPLQGALSLDFGGCWVRQETSEPRWKLVSFSDRVASNLGANEFQQTLNQPISSILQGAFKSFPESVTDTFYRCSAGGHFFWTSIPDGPLPLCVWSKVERDPKSGQLALRVLDVYPDYQYRPGQPCNGVSRRSLIIALITGADIDAVIDYLRTDERYAGVFTELSPIGRLAIAARLEVAYDFREDAVKELLDTDKALESDVQRVDYDGLVSIVGESFRLFAGRYPGY